MYQPLKFITQSVTTDHGEEVGILTDQRRQGGRFGHGGGIITAEHDDSQAAKSWMSTVGLKHHINDDGSWHVELTPQVPLRFWLLGEKDEPLAVPTFHSNQLIAYNFSVNPEQYEAHVCDEVYQRFVGTMNVDSTYDLQLSATATMDVKPDKTRGWHVAIGLVLSNEQQGGAIIGLQDMDPTSVPENGNWFNVPDGTRVVLLGVMIGYPCDEHGVHQKFVPWSEWCDVMPGPDGKRQRRGLGALLEALAASRNPFDADMDPALKVDPSKVH